MGEKVRLSDYNPIKLQPTNKEEEYILEEARVYLDETGLSSHWAPSPHVDNVIALGKKNTPFLIEFLRENDNPQGLYSHFLIDVLFGLYKDDIKVEGYLGVTGCVKLLIKMYDSGVLYKEEKEDENELPENKERD